MKGGDSPATAARPPLDVVERLLADAGGPLRVLAVTLLKSWARNDVWRARVTGGSRAPGAPPSVIIKRFKAEPARGLDEWAALGLLTDAGIDPAPAPRFLGGDPTARCFVMEDLGAGPSLEDLLRSREPDAGRRAAEALCAIAGLTGRLHAATRGLTADFDRRRDGLAHRPLAPAAAAARGLRQRCRDLDAWLDAVGEAGGRGVDDALEVLARFVEEPGDWTTVTHGDMAPSNSICPVGGWRLLDFEYAGARPALYDALLWTLFCPLPPLVIEDADRAYREALAAGFPLAHDDAVYATARARVAAWRTLDLLHWLPPALLAADRPWAPGLDARDAVTWHLARFLTMAAAAPDDLVAAPIAAAARRLERRLVERWGRAPDAGAVWPAFAVDRL
jgi:hypothetical protein